MPGQSIPSEVERSDRPGHPWRRLRDSSRHWFLGALVLLGGVVLIAGGAQKAAVPKVVEAERFVLKDKAGVVRGEWGIDAGPGGHTSSFLNLNDTTGKRRVSLSFADFGNGVPVLSFHQHDEKGRLLIGLHQDGSPFLMLLDDKGKAETILPATPVAPAAPAPAAPD